MADAALKIGEEDIKKFIIPNRYGEGPGWPSGRGATIVLSTVEIYYTKYSSMLSRDGKHSSILSREYKRTINAVYKNEGHQEHAEGYFLADLEEKIATFSKDKKALKIYKIQANLVQNYSPCNNYSDDKKSGCADDILEFKKRMRPINFSLRIKFANFYCLDDKSNTDGLIKLLRNGVELELLQSEDDWKEFLYDETFVDLKLLGMATSEGRKKREKEDVHILNGIKSEASGKQNATKEYSHTVKLMLL
jgi:hypothetical protein